MTATMPTEGELQRTVDALRRELEVRSAERDEARAERAATAEILEVINSSPADLAPVFEAILRNAHALCGVAHGSLQILEDGSIRAVALHGIAESLADRLRRPRAAAEAPMLQLLLQGQRYSQVSDVRESDSPVLRSTAELQGARTLLSVPLRREGKLLGMIICARLEVKPFTEREISLLESFAAQAVVAIENARLLQELRARTSDLTESLRQQTATAEVLEVINGSPGNLAPVFDTMLEKAIRLCDAVSGHFRTYDGKSFPLASVWGEPEHVAATRLSGALVPGPNHPVSRFLRGESLIHLPDARESEEYRADDRFRALVDRGVLSVLAVALRKDGLLFGYINVYRHVAEPFTDRQIALLQNFSSQAVIAMENARLFDELQAKTHDIEEALRYQTGSGNILNVIASSPTDVQPVLKAIVESACELCEAYDAVALLEEGDHLQFSAHHGPIPMTFGTWPINRKWTAGRAFVDKKAVHVHDLLSEQDEFPDGLEMSKAMGHRTIVSVPLQREGESIGVLVLRRTEVNPFTDKQIALLQTFADQAVIALGNVRLFDEVQAKTRDLTESLVYQTGSSNILKVIASSPTDVGPALKAIVESACEICDAYDALVFLKEGSDLVFAAHHGSMPIQINRWPINRKWVTGRAVVDKATQHVVDMFGPEGDDFPEGRQLAQHQGLRTVLSVPLLREGEVIGVISLRQVEVQPFNRKQIELLQSFADQAVIAISNVRLFDQVQERTRELSQSLDDLRTAQDRLVQTQKLASLGQLTAGIAHEIKNPLNFVNNFAALSIELTDELNDMLKQAAIADKLRAEADELTGLLKDNLAKVVQHGKRADSIVKNMLLHSREGSGEHRPADINALVDESLNLAYHGARAEKPQFNVTLQRNFDPEAGMVDVFPQEITRVFLNLLSNGFYAVTKRKADNGTAGFEPTVSATTKGRPDSIEIRIRDNGTGIPLDVKEKMFNPFFTTKPAGEGTGLGLSMSYDIIVKQHGGTIDVETLPGEFTEFTIVLPRTSLSGKN